MIINVLWVVAVNGAIAPQMLARQSGTVLMSLAVAAGPVVHVLGAIFVVSSMGLGSIQFSLALFNLARERLAHLPTAVGPRGRFLLALSPVAIVFLVAEWVILTNTGSFAGVLGFLGVMVDSLMTGIFPTLLLVAGRRKGELVPGVVYRFLGHPVLIAAVYLLFLSNLFFHALVIWQNPAQRVGGVLVGLVIVVLTVDMVRRGAFHARVVVELRDDQRTDGCSLVAITAAGRRAPAEVRLGYPDGEQFSVTAGETPAAYATLRRVTVDIAATGARELKVWAHRVTPLGDTEGLAALLTVQCGDQARHVDLGQSGGQTVLPIDGRRCHLKITLPAAASMSPDEERP